MYQRKKLGMINRNESGLPKEKRGRNGERGKGTKGKESFKVGHPQFEQDKLEKKGNPRV